MNINKEPEAGENPTHTQPTVLDSIDELWVEIHFKENSIPSVIAGKLTEKSKAVIRDLCNKQVVLGRQFDDYGNPIFILNEYEAKAVVNLIKSVDRKYDTGDWFLDIPRKVEKRLDELKAAQPHKGKE